MSDSAGGGAPLGPTYDRNDPNVKAMNKLMESCVGKSVVSGIMGFGLGGMFGMFMASMAYDGAPGTTSTAPGMQNISNLPWRRQLAIGFKDMGSRSWSTAKNFGMVGGLYSGIECGVEGFRAKNDLWNSAVSGCLAGGILARNAGPLAACGGCAAFAGFSTAIDAYMRSSGGED